MLQPAIQFCEQRMMKLGEIFLKKKEKSMWDLSEKMFQKDRKKSWILFVSWLSWKLNNLCSGALPGWLFQFEEQCHFPKILQLSERPTEQKPRGVQFSHSPVIPQKTNRWNAPQEQMSCKQTWS